MHRIPALLFLAVACARPCPAEEDSCVEHLKAIGVAAFKYPERAEKMPVGHPEFFEALAIDPASLRCPATPKEESGSILTDYESWSAHRISPAMIAKFGEILPLAWDASPRHEGARNVVYADGHVETMVEADFQERMGYFQDQEEFDWSGKVRLDPATRDWGAEWKAIAERMVAGQEVFRRGTDAWRSLQPGDRSSDAFRQAVEDVTSGFSTFEFEPTRAYCLLEAWKKHLESQGLGPAEVSARLASQTAELEGWRHEYRDGVQLYVEVDRALRER